MSKKRIKLSTPKDVKKAVNRVANMVLNGELDSKSANAILYAANITLSTIKTDEQQKQIEEIERILNERGIEI